MRNSNYEKYVKIDTEYKIPKFMKAIRMSTTGIENLKVDEVPVPEPNDNQILARVDACTICPSTLKLLSQGSQHSFLYGWDINKYPIILGDEGAVTAIKVGKNLRRKYKVGEKLCIQPAVDYYPINFKNRYRNSESIRKLAVGYTLGGHLAEYILIQEEVINAGCLLKLPSQNMGYYEISLTEPLSCVVSSQDHHIHLVKDKRTGERKPYKGILKNGVVVIFGAGVMARFHIELAMHFNPLIIVVFNRNEKRFEWIKKNLSPRAKKKKIKLFCVKLPEKSQIKKVFKKLTGKEWADDIIDATGVKEIQQMGLELVGKGSVFNSFGGLNIDDPFLNVNMRMIHYNEAIITGSSGGNFFDTKKTLDFVYKGVFNVGKQIQWVGDLDDAIGFLKLIKERKINGKAIVYPHAFIEKPFEVFNGWNKEKEKSFLNKNLMI